MAKTHLLIIDDEPDICRFVENVAEGLGFDVATATRVEEFRDGYESLVPSTILVDLHMPEVDGVELMERIDLAGPVSPLGSCSVG